MCQQQLLSLKSKHLAYNSSRVQQHILQENQLLVSEEEVVECTVVEDNHSLVEEGTLVEEDTLVEGNLVLDNLVEDKHLLVDTLVGEEHQ
jgi:hypothetical protein